MIVSVSKRLIKYLFSCILFFIGFFSCIQICNAGEMTIHTVNVGQGDGIVIESNGHYMIVDAGKTSSSSTFLKYLNNLNIPNKKIDYIVATHPDEDHVGGFSNVFANYDISKAYYSACPKTTKAYKRFVTAMKNEGCSCKTPKDGETWKLGDATVSVVYDGTQGSTYNECSIVLKVTCDKKSILLTADLPTTIENVLIKKKYNLKADILKVGHHGAAASTSKSFIKAVNPSYAIISSGPYSVASTPKPSVLKRLASAFVKTYQTTSGNIVFNIKNGVISTKNKEKNGYTSIKKGYLRLNKYSFYAPAEVGREVTPNITLFVNNVAVPSSLYTVKFHGNTHTGRATVKVTGLENPYIDSISTTFKIKPRKPKIYSVTAKPKKIVVGWTVQTSCSGYQIQYSTNKKFKKKVKKKTVKKGKTTTTTLKHLKSKKKYFIRVRAFTSDIGYGKWSKKVKCKTK